MEQGCSFLWPAGCRPMMCLPSGKLVQLEVHHFIPYLKSSGDDEDSEKLAAPALAALLPFLEKSHGAEAARTITERMCVAAPSETGPTTTRSCLKPAKLPIPILPPTKGGFQFVKGFGGIGGFLRYRMDVDDVIGDAMGNYDEDFDPDEDFI